MAVRFYPQVAVSSETGELATPGEAGTIVLPGSNEPAPISEDAEGVSVIPGSELSVSSIGLVPGFWLQGEELEVEWLAADGLTRIPIFSPVGLMEAARETGLAMHAVRFEDGTWPPRPPVSGEVTVMWIGGGYHPPGAAPGDLHVSLL